MIEDGGREKLRKRNDPTFNKKEGLEISGLGLWKSPTGEG